MTQEDIATILRSGGRPGYDRLVVRMLFLAVLAACAHPAPLPADPPTTQPDDQLRHYTIWLGGSRIGTATESETWSLTGVHLRRLEAMRFLRGDAVVELATSIDIDASATLVPRRVKWTEIGADARSEEVVHDASGWSNAMPAAAVPAELLPLLVRRDGHFEGPVFLPARGFIAGTSRIEPVAPHRLIARLTLAGPTLAEATIDLDRDGMPARVVDGEGVIERRTSAFEAAVPFPAVDLIAATAIPISGPHGHRLILDGDLALPPLPGQKAQPGPAGVTVELGARLPGDLPAADPGPDRTRTIASLVQAVRGRITPDLGTSPSHARDASAAAGDCTTFALAYAALATTRGIPTRVVTGLRVDGDRLVRHRWAVSWTGTRWIAVDAAFGAAPAGGDLIGLAIHDADDAGLVSGEAALTQVRAASWAD
jgi:hypothetical protein